MLQCGSDNSLSLAAWSSVDRTKQLGGFGLPNLENIREWSIKMLWLN